jgi:uncharacterized protein (TIGR03663 family)
MATADEAPPSRLRRSVIGHWFVIWISTFVILSLALAVRVWRLSERPMHPDEANQAVRAGELLQSGQYRYDPGDHHGPSLYWFTLPVLRLCGAADLAGMQEWMVRLVPALFGTGLVLLLALVADGLGSPATVAAALLTALSPAMVYYSRYYVHEMLLVFFTLAVIACGWRYVCRPTLFWAAAVGSSVGLVYSTKETGILALLAMAIGLAVTVPWARWCGNRPPPSHSASGGTKGAGPPPDGRPPIPLPLSTYFRPGAVVLAGLAGVLVAAALYSSFGRNGSGLADSVRAFAQYARRGAQGDLHAHPWYRYFEWLCAYRPGKGFFWSEGLIVALAAVAGLAAFWPGGGGRAAGGGQQAAAHHPSSVVCHPSSHYLPPSAHCPLPTAHCPLPSWPLVRFLTVYTLVLAGLYSAIPYKTPWCLLSFLNGMILLAGVGAWWLMRIRRLRAVAAILLAAGVLHLGRQAYQLNFRFAADQRNPWVYAHTSTDVLRLADLVGRLAAASPDRAGMPIHVVGPANYWPLPWYLRRLPAGTVGYWPDADAWQRDLAGLPRPSVALAAAEFDPAVAARLPADYGPRGIYGLRPQVLVSLWVEGALWRRFLDSRAAPGST